MRPAPRPQLLAINPVLANPALPQQTRYQFRPTPRLTVGGCHQKIRDNDPNYTFTIAAALILISGGARGVDETAMLAALDAGGYVIGILPDSLLKASTSRKWRTAL